MKVFLERIKGLPTRKEQALAIIQAYGSTARTAFLFKMLDGKELEQSDRKKLLYQCLA
jgi:hypothetical protein